MDVFLFFSRRPSQTRDALTYGSEKNNKDIIIKKDTKIKRENVRELATALHNASTTLILMLITASIMIVLALAIH